jgi:hypothetical protein
MLERRVVLCLPSSRVRLSVLSGATPSPEVQTIVSSTSCSSASGSPHLEARVIASGHVVRIDSLCSSDMKCFQPLGCRLPRSSAATDAAHLLGVPPRKAAAASLHAPR